MESSAIQITCTHFDARTRALTHIGGRQNNDAFWHLTVARAVVAISGGARYYIDMRALVYAVYLVQGPDGPHLETTFGPLDAVQFPKCTEQP